MYAVVMDRVAAQQAEVLARYAAQQIALKPDIDKKINKNRYL